MRVRSRIATHVLFVKPLSPPDGISQFLRASDNPIMIQKLLLLACLSLFSLLCMNNAHAQGGPPLITDDPGTPGDGKWEVSLGLISVSSVSGLLTDGYFQAPVIDSNYGVGKRLQLNFQTALQIHTTPGERTYTSFGQTLIGVKWRILDQDDVGIYPSFFSNNPPFSRTAYVFWIPVEVNRSFGPFAANFEVGYQYATDSPQVWLFGLALGYEVSKPVQVLAEIHATPTIVFSSAEVVANVGIVWSFNSSVALIASAGTSLLEPADTPNKVLTFLGTKLNF
jgi:hypothetical protein